MPAPQKAAPFALVVEDDPDAAHIFQQALQDAGYLTEVAATGHTAQARLAFTNPDLIVLDMRLPQLSGEVVLRQLRGRKRLHRTHVVVATGDERAAAAYGEFADQVLLKPIGYEQLRSLAENLISVAA